jgi:hypothetical protein
MPKITTEYVPALWPKANSIIRDTITNGMSVRVYNRKRVHKSVQKFINTPMLSYGEYMDEKFPEPFQYPKAGKNAQPGINKDIETYKKLPPEEKAKTPLLWWLLGSTTQDYKMSKKDALYTEESKTAGQKCSNCRFAYQHITSGRYICSMMRGNIEPGAWCRLWEADKEKKD